jgi:chemotaxis protein methyltransferase CheR
VQQLRQDPAARRALFDEMTVQETSFFRDAAQLDLLTSEVLPQLPDPVVVWCAGCANGQEAYSIAMALTEQGRQGLVHATDLSGRAVERARQGVYAERELRGLSEQRRRRWLRPHGADWRVTDELRAMVHVQRHNLLAEVPPVTRVPVVFCRNVLIYFPADAVRQAVGRFASALTPDGWLFLGFSESLWKVDQRFTARRYGSSYVHRPATTPAPAPAPPPVLTSTRRPATAPRPAPAVASARRPVVEAAPAVPTLVDLLADGETALRAGQHDRAVRAFRAAAFLNPSQALPHLQLSLALEALGEPAASRRALQAARHALLTGGAGPAEGALGGWDEGALRRFIDRRLEEGRGG